MGGWGEQGGGGGGSYGLVLYLRSSAGQQHSLPAGIRCPPSCSAAAIS